MFLKHYHINQFEIASEIELPADKHLSANSIPLKKMKIYYRPSTLANFKSATPIGSLDEGFHRSYEVEGGVLICIADRMRMFVSAEGGEITLDVDSDLLPLASLWVTNLGLALATLFHGGIPLHAAGAVLRDKYFGIIGISGAGKSTLLGELLSHGAMFGNDDQIPIDIESGSPVAIPCTSLLLKRSAESIHRKGLQPHEYREAYPGNEEYFTTVSPERRMRKTAVLDTIFLLKPNDSADKVLSYRHRGNPSLMSLYIHTHALWTVYEKLSVRDLFNRYQIIFNHTNIYILEYPKRYEILPALIDEIDKLLAV